MKLFRFSVLIGGLLASIASVLAPNEDDIPEADVCEGSSEAGVDHLRVVHGESSGSATEVADYEEMPMVFGSQGGAMVPVRIRLTGGAVPSCARLVLTLEHCLDLGCERVTDDPLSQQIPLQTYQEGSDRITRDYYLILPYPIESGALVRLRVVMGSASTETLMWIEQEASFADAGPMDSGIVIDADMTDADIGDTGLSDTSDSDGAPADDEA
jgi:hypothetical protein